MRRKVEDVDVTLDGEPVDFEMLVQGKGRFDVAKIGSADEYVPAGEHQYVITYAMPTAIEPGYQGSESSFYWDLIPSGWAQDIDRATLTVNLPAEAENLQCGVGLSDDPPRCEGVTGQGTKQVVVTSGPLANHTPVTLRVGLDVPTPEPDELLPWTARYDVTLGQSTTALYVVLAAALLAGILGLVAAQRAKERTPPFPLVYGPPDGVGPAQGAYVLTERVNRAAYVASLMHAAESGAIDLHRHGASWTIADKSGAHGWAGLDPVTTSTAHLLGGPGTSFTADPKSVAAGERLKTEIATFDTFVKEWGRASGNLELVKGGAVPRAARVPGLLRRDRRRHLEPVQHGAGGARARQRSPSSGIGLLRAGARTRRTERGRLLWSQLGGFRRILATPSATQRFDFSGREELYTAFVPWAVAFGCAEEWAEKYETEMGHEPPQPHYFGAYAGGYGGGSVASMVDDFDSAVDSAISSYDATQSSSSSGGGGLLRRRWRRRWRRWLLVSTGDRR